MLTYASDINDLGQIDANATLNGVTRAFRLDPTNTPTNTLPNVSYSVSVRVKPKKFGTVKGAGAFPSGAFITLKAKPKIGHTFVCWKEGKKTLSTQRKLSFTLTAAALAPSLNKYRPKPTET